MQVEIITEKRPAECFRSMTLLSTWKRSFKSWTKKPSEATDSCTKGECEREVLLEFSFKHFSYSSFDKVRYKFEEHFVENHKDRLLSECSSMVEGERKRELANLYILLKPLPPHMSHLIQTLQDHIQKKGLESISNLCGENVSP
jgi:cullin 2